VAAWRLGLAACLVLATTAAAAPYRPPRTPDGRPDLQGLWDGATLTPLERSADFKSVVIPEAEVEAHERKENDTAQFTAEFKKTYPNAPDVGAAETEYPVYVRYARIAGQARASVLIDPPDGKLPLNAEAKARNKARRLQESRSFDSYENRPLAERCLNLIGPPLVTGDVLQIVQTRDRVAIAPEGAVDARVIRIGDRRHGPAALQAWMGDSIGWWEGDVLVVESTNFHPGSAWWRYFSRMPISPGAKVTERFSRTSATEMLYRFTVDDPANYTRPWSGVLPFTAYGGRLFEYACHEGNYALRNILAGARQVEREGRTPEPLDGGDPPPKPAAAS